MDGLFKGGLRRHTQRISTALKTALRIQRACACPPPSRVLSLSLSRLSSGKVARLEGLICIFVRVSKVFNEDLARRPVRQIRWSPHAERDGAIVAEEEEVEEEDDAGAQAGGSAPLRSTLQTARSQTMQELISISLSLPPPPLCLRLIISH